MVTQQYHNGILSQTRIIQSREYPTNLRVNKTDAGIISLTDTLLFIRRNRTLI